MRILPLTLILAMLGALASPDAAIAQTALTDIRAYLPISDRLATGGQVTYEQIPTLAEAGFEVVINLATADEERNGREGFLVAQQGMTYVNIPVSWPEPSLEHLQQFFEVMRANQDRKVFVHCFANMRVSAFTYLYRTLELKDADAAARADLLKIWDPFTNEQSPQWRAFLESARQR